MATHKKFRSRAKARVATAEKSGPRPDLGRDRGLGRPTGLIIPNTTRKSKKILKFCKKSLFFVDISIFGFFAILKVLPQPKKNFKHLIWTQHEKYSLSLINSLDL
jgi:hypothetical protein